jgi:DNA-binding SARP family transcriptional activator/tetratricopeptide (TPR) repeat protein
MSNYHLRLFGAPTVELAGESVSLTIREALLLAYLNEHAPHAIQRTILASHFWPSAPTARGLRSLSQLLYQLKRKLRGIPFSTSENDVRLYRLPSDVDYLRRLVKDGSCVQALRLYRGSLFNNAGLPSPELDLWHTALAAEVSGLLATAVQLGLPAAEEEEDLKTIIDAATRLIAEGCAPPSVYHACICALLKTGATHKARVLYDDITSETIDDDAFAFRSFEELQSTVADSAPQDNGPRSVKFVGRRDELAEIQKAWEQVVQGSGKVVLISGEPGIGKSRLADQVLRRIALGGGRVWAARCHAATRRSALSTVLDLLNQFEVRNDASLPLRLRSTLSALLDPGASDAAAQQLTSEQWQYRRLEALSQVISHASKVRPLAVFFDDVQWADDLTAQVITLWALRVPAIPVLLIMTARTEEADPLPEWITNELSGQLHVRLGQLTIEAASELVAAFLAKRHHQLSEDTRSRVLWQSAGRPLLLLEALHEASRGEGGAGDSGGVFLPETAEQLLRRRFRGLTSDAMWLTGLAAVYGTAIEPRILAEMSGLRDDCTMAALDVLSTRGILEFRAGKLSFPHDLMRETAYRVLAPATRSLLHRRIASEMSCRGASDGFLADHYAQSGDCTMAGLHALKAARSAQDNRLHSDCVHYYKLALDVGTVDDGQTAARELARYLAQVGRLNEGEELLPILRVQGDSREAALLADLIELERELVNGSADNALARARGVVEQAAALQSFDLAMVLGPLLDVAHDAGNLEFASQLLETFRQVANQVEQPTFSMQIQVLSATWEGTTVGYAPGWRRLQETSFEDQSVPLLTQTLAWYAKGTLLLLSGNLRSAVSALEVATHLATQAGEFRRLAAAEMNMAVALTELGEFERARGALEGLLTSPHRAYRLRAITNLAILQYEQGDDNLVLSTAQAILSTNACYGSAKYAAIASGLMGLVALRQRDYDGANLHYEWLTANTCEKDYLSGDPGYTVSFVARMLAHHNQQHRALAVLESAIAAASHRDHVSGLRLALTRAHVLCSLHDEGAYPAAKYVQRQALASGAACLATDASQLMEVTR